MQFICKITIFEGYCHLNIFAFPHMHIQMDILEVDMYPFQWGPKDPKPT